MKTTLHPVRTGPPCGALVALAAAFVFIVQVKAAPVQPQGAAPKSFAPIPWSGLGARAGADYKGDGLVVTPKQSGARLRCAFQRLEGEATTQGLWLLCTMETADKLVRFIRPGVIEE